MTVTKNPRYLASCRLRLPFDGTAQETVCFEAGPTRPGQASYRLEFNPSKLSKLGLDDLIVFLNSFIDADPIEFFRGSKSPAVTWLSTSVGHRLEDVIVRSSRLQKHGVYADRYGTVQTTYLGTPRSRCVVAYDKPLEGSLVTRLRLECRLKPRCLGYQLAQLKDPFAGVQLLRAGFSEGQRHRRSRPVNRRQHPNRWPQTRSVAARWLAAQGTQERVQRRNVAPTQPRRSLGCLARHPRQLRAWQGTRSRTCHGRGHRPGSQLQTGVVARATLRFSLPR